MDLIHRNPKLYFIGGKAMAGKSTTGKIIKDIYEQKGKKATVIQYSRYIKDYAKAFFGWDGRAETKPRELLQKLGTDIIREKLNMPFLFVNRITDDLKILSYFFDVLIIDDVRFKIEIDMQRQIFNNLVAVMIVRDNFDNGLTEEQRKHSTEIDLDDYHSFDYEIHNDGTIDDLREKVKTIIDEEEKQNEKNEQ